MESLSYILDNLLKQQKNNRLLCFKDLSKENIAKAITALSNERGGDILIGVDSNQKVLGIKVEESKIDDLSSYIKEQIHPIPAFNIYPISYSNSTVILISVWQGAMPPYNFEDGFYCLQGGGAIVKAKVNDIDKLFQNRREIDNGWERQLSSANMEDLNKSLIAKTIRQNSAEKEDSGDLVEFLMKKGLFRQGAATNGCVILFANHPTQFIPQALIRMSIYDEKNELVQTLSFEGCLLDTIPQLFEKLKNLYWSEVVIEGLSRVEKKSYPELAIREAVLNAMIHREYNTQTSFLNINLYANRIEISNYGTLPYGMKTTDLKKNHLSILRNPDIANICYLNNYIEMAGSGTLRILRDCKENGFPEPKWICNENYVKITFPGIMMRHPSQSKESAINAYLSNMSSDKRDDMLRIVAFIEENPYSKSKDIIKQIDKSVATVKRYLTELQNLSLIRYEGSKRYGGYVIVNSNK